MTGVNNQKPIYWMQYLCTIAATVCVFITGIHMGWVGPSLPVIRNEIRNTTSFEDAVLANFLQVGGLPAPFIGSYLCDKIGRQKVLLLTSIPNAISFLLIACANNLGVLYVARLFCGFAIGVNFVAAPTYVGEIASPEIRGLMGAIIGFMIGVGVIFQFTLVPLVSSHANALICLGITVIGAIATFVIPDSPYYFIMKGDKEKATKTLKALRQRDDVEKECTELELAWDANKDQIVGRLEFFKNKYNMHYFLVMIGIFAAQTFSGMIQIMSFSSDILRDFHAPINEYVAGVINMSTMTLTALICVFFVDRWGRKPLFYISTFGGAGPLFIIGTYLCVLSFAKEPFSSEMSMFPLVCLLLYTFCFSMGLNTLPYIFISELFSTQARASAACLAQFVSSVMGIVAIQAFQLVKVNFGMATAFWCCGALNILFAIFCIFFVPETKGKNLSEINSKRKSDIETTAT